MLHKMGYICKYTASVFQLSSVNDIWESCISIVHFIHSVLRVRLLFVPLGFIFWYWQTDYRLPLTWRTSESWDGPFNTTEISATFGVAVFAMNTSVVRAKILWSRLKVFGTIGPNNSTGGVQFTSTMSQPYTAKTFLLFIIYRDRATDIWAFTWTTDWTGHVTLRLSVGRDRAHSTFWGSLGHSMFAVTSYVSSGSLLWQVQFFLKPSVGAAASEPETLRNSTKW